MVAGEEALPFYQFDARRVLLTSKKHSHLKVALWPLPDAARCQGCEPVLWAVSLCFQGALQLRTGVSFIPCVCVPVSDRACSRNFQVRKVTRALHSVQVQALVSVGGAEANKGAGQRVLIIGGDGYCGWASALHLSARGYDVRGRISVLRDAFRLYIKQHQSGASFLFCRSTHVLRQHLAVAALGR